MKRAHYIKGASIAELWEDDKQALLPLPSVPFEPVELVTARVNKYCQVHCPGEIYTVPGAQVGETVLVKRWWDRVEILGRTGVLLTTLPRHYTLKTQPIDWKGYFGIFVRKPPLCQDRRCATRRLKYMPLNGWTGATSCPCGKL